jgi:hypothetical protein
MIAPTKDEIRRALEHIRAAGFDVRPGRHPQWQFIRTSLGNESIIQTFETGWDAINGALKHVIAEQASRDDAYRLLANVWNCSIEEAQKGVMQLHN